MGSLYKRGDAIWGLANACVPSTTMLRETCEDQSDPYKNIVGSYKKWSHKTTRFRSGDLTIGGPNGALMKDLDQYFGVFFRGGDLGDLMDTFDGTVSSGSVTHKCTSYPQVCVLGAIVTSSHYYTGFTEVGDTTKKVYKTMSISGATPWSAYSTSGDLVYIESRSEFQGSATYSFNSTSNAWEITSESRERRTVYREGPDYNGGGVPSDSEWSAFTAWTQKDTYNEDYVALSSAFTSMDYEKYAVEVVNEEYDDENNNTGLFQMSNGTIRPRNVGSDTIIIREQTNLPNDSLPQYDSVARLSIRVAVVGVPTGTYKVELYGAHRTYSYDYQTRDATKGKFEKIKYADLSVTVESDSSMAWSDRYEVTLQGGYEYRLKYFSDAEFVEDEWDFFICPDNPNYNTLYRYGGMKFQPV